MDIDKITAVLNKEIEYCMAKVEELNIDYKNGRYSEEEYQKYYEFWLGKRAGIASANNAIMDAMLEEVFNKE